MRTKPITYNDGRLAEPAGIYAGIARRIGARLLHEVREALPPTILFFVGFNFIVLTTNLLVANKIPLLRRYDRAPLIQPSLFKTAFYWVVVFLARLLERFVHFALEGNPPGHFTAYLMTTFSWHRFSAISLWILVLFLIYVTASEFSHLFGPGEMRRLLFTRRPSDLQLNRRQRLRELLRLSRLTDEHSGAELRDPTSAAHRELIDIVQHLAR